MGDAGLRGPTDGQTEPIGAGQQAGRRVAEPQDLSVERDGQWLVGAVHEERRTQQEQERQRPPVSPERSQPLYCRPDLAGTVLALGPLPSSRDAQPSGQEGGHKPQDSGDQQHSPRSDHVCDQPSQGEPEEE